MRSNERQPMRRDVHELRPRTVMALAALQKELALEPDFRGVQVTFNDVHSKEEPPTVDVRYIGAPGGSTGRSHG